MPYDAIVIGGGLAGCSVALQLARQNHDVALLEKATYPRHKLCGEFLSPEAQSSLAGLGVLDVVREAGAASITETQLTGPTGTVSEHALPGTAIGLSRYRLDGILFRAACAQGVDGHTGTKATAVEGSFEDGFAVQTDGEKLRGRLVIGAYGRRGVLDRTLERPFLQQSSPYVAFKAHFAGPHDVDSPGTIELHAAPGGYCGVGPVEDDRVNVCWIGRTDALKDAGGTPEAMLNTLRQNPKLDARLRPLSRVSERFEAVSQVPLMSKSRFAGNVCMVGDAAGMIAPLCGDGMAMALDAADLLTPLADELLAGNRSPNSFRSAYEQKWQRTFGRRMRIGRWVHTAAFRPNLTTALLYTCTALPPLARWLIRATRG